VESYGGKSNYSKRLKVIHTDNGEFTSHEFEAYLYAEGVCHELTIPKSPEQIGVAECMNQIQDEAVRSMSHANLPHRFWGKALSTVAYLQKRSPPKAVCEMTPL